MFSKACVFISKALNNLTKMEMQMKTIGIVTIEDYTNYGNRLQNYALTKLFEAEGFKVVNGIRVFTKEDYINCTHGILKKIAKFLIPYCLIKDRINPKQRQYTGFLKIRENNFIKFVQDYTHPLSYIFTLNHKKAMEFYNNYGIDYFVAGSDQIWNPNFAASADMFLAFAPKEKRLSFAASIGVDEIPSLHKKRFQKYIKDMRYLSVREQRAVEIIKELTGRDATLTLDPTLLLESEKWQAITKKPHTQMESHYICTYFLGEIPEAVEHFAKSKELKVYSLNDENNPDLFVLEPREFLYVIQNADYVLTDSFHAVAFSIKFNKEFYVFKRKESGLCDMFSRIDDITKKFGLENRIQNRNKIHQQPQITNWKDIDNVLIIEKKKSMTKLLEVIN